jgi:hypothetical protein
VVGTLSKNVAYLFADSVITSISASPEALKGVLVPFDSTSIGETVIRDDSTIVQESCQKIEVVSDRLVIAFASNDANEAFHTIENIKDSPLLDADLVGCINHFTKHQPPLQLLISHRGDDGIVRLYSYNTTVRNQVVQHSEGSIVHLGSLPEEYHAITEKYFKVILSMNEDGSLTISEDKLNSMKLQLMNALLQTYFYTDTLKNGVGGIYNGVWHSSQSFRRLSDTAYIIIEGNDVRKLTLRFIGCFNRKNLTVVTSPFFDRPFRILYTYAPPNRIKVRQEQLNSWLEDHTFREEVFNKINSTDYETFIFMHHNKQKDIIKILCIPNYNNRVKEHFEIGDKAIRSVSGEFLQKVLDVLEGDGELIEFL